MATKKFAQMSTKKLNALLETASEEDAVAIRAILETRAAQASIETVESAEELSEEEKAAIEAAEKTETPEGAEPTNGEEKKKVGRKSSAVKLTEEEYNEAYKNALENVGHRCTVTLPNTAISVDGTIVSVVRDKRVMQVYYAIKTDAIDDMEPRTIYKKVGFETTIHEEVVELKKKADSKARVAKKKMEAGEWEAEADVVYEAASQNIGKLIQLNEETEGRIISLLNDKRSAGMYYRIEFTNELGVKKVCHKVINYTKAEDGTIVLAEVEGLAAELDEAGQELQAAFQERKSREPRKILTPEEKVLAAEEALKKAEATLAKAQETYQMRQNALELAKAELNNKFDNQAEFAGAGAGDEELA